MGSLLEYIQENVPLGVSMVLECELNIADYGLSE